MATLYVSEFSCIKYVQFELAPVTVVIGPQGSGKSVTTKLFYYFCDIIDKHYDSAEKGLSEEQFRKSLAKSFTQWFPPSAWGYKRFNINFSAGNFTARILRRRSAGQLADEVTISFSDWFSQQYSRSLKAYEEARNLQLDDESSYRRSLETSYRIRDGLQEEISRSLGDEHIHSQTFIPAGREFFTSLGRFVAGFEGGGHLDPVTLRFAKLYANLRDRNSIMHFSSTRSLPEEASNRRIKFLERVFGGELRNEGDQEFVQTKDGRKIPFSALSSGQQELLPMWSIIDYFSQIDAMRARAKSVRSKENDLIYIEEPEAHLFPSAQSLLMEYLIGSLSTSAAQRNLIITTHSPYIMSKINVFIKAGQLARRKKVNKQIDEIIPRECWLGEGEVTAYALQDGEMIDILDEDGLIDGTYLDQISEDISNEYSSLLHLEATI